MIDTITYYISRVQMEEMKFLRYVEFRGISGKRVKSLRYVTCARVCLYSFHRNLIPDAVLCKLVFRIIT